MDPLILLVVVLVVAAIVAAVVTLNISYWRHIRPKMTAEEIEEHNREMSIW